MFVPLHNQEVMLKELLFNSIILFLRFYQFRRLIKPVISCISISNFLNLHEISATEYYKKQSISQAKSLHISYNKKYQTVTVKSSNVPKRRCPFSLPSNLLVFYFICIFLCYFVLLFVYFAFLLLFLNLKFYSRLYWFHILKLWPFTL